MKSEADALADFDREFAKNLATVTPAGRATSKQLPDIDEPPPVNGLQDYGLSDGERVEDEPTETIEPLALTDAASWQGKPVPERQWVIHNRIPVGKPVLLSGDGATGKTTIAVQAAVAVRRGTDWLEAVVERSGPVLIVSAEEGDDEMQFCTDAVAKHYGASLSELGGIKFHCIPAGQDAVLGLPDRNGIVRETKLFWQIEETIKREAPVMAILETAADLFACDENNRNHARQSIGLLRRLCNLPSRPAIVLLAHPSLSGLATGRGTSGSTGWHNSVRARMYFSKPKSKNGNDDDDHGDDTTRVLEVMKSNYGPAGEKVAVRWTKGVFVPVGGPTSFERIAADANVDNVFLSCLEAAASQGIVVSPLEGRNYAPKIFADMVEAQGLKQPAFKLALLRLLSAGKIINTTIGKGSHAKASLIRKDAEP